LLSVTRSDKTNLHPLALEKIVFVFVQSETTRLFDLDLVDFLSDTSNDSVLARFAAFHVIYSHVETSHTSIANYFGKTRRQVRYSVRRCSEMLESKSSYKSFNAAYETIEENLIYFLSHLNT